MREHDGDNHIVIRWWAGPVLVAVYALYVVVAATYDSILARLGAAPAPRADLPPPEGAELDRPLALGRRSSLIYEDEPAANFLTSISVARRGLGNMAVSNALGSNSFNIYIGLGLPWLIYTAVIGPYHALPADDIVGPVLVLVATLLAFLVLLACTGFTLRRGHGVVFLALYLAFLVWAVAKEYPQLLSI